MLNRISAVLCVIAEFIPEQETETGVPIKGIPMKDRIKKPIPHWTHEDDIDRKMEEKARKF
jgi:hypothetical protein